MSRPSRPELSEQIPMLIEIERGVVEQMRPQMQAALEQKLEAVVADLEREAPECSGCGKTMAVNDRRWVGWISLFGPVRVQARRYRCRRCGRSERPAICRLGIEPGQISGVLARLLALLGTISPFVQASLLAERLLGVRVSAMSVWRCVQRLGAAAESHEQASSDYHADSRSDAAVPEEPPPQVAVVEVDGCALGMQTRTRRRRGEATSEPLAPAEASSFREVKSAVLMRNDERFESSPGRRTVLRRRLVSCLGSADAIFARLWSALEERGWVAAETMVVVVADGAEWIWNRAAEAFPRRCEILDFWHAVEHAWDFARVHFGDGSARGAAWVARLARDLKAGRIDQVLTRLARMKPTREEARHELEALLRYYRTHRERMRYDRYLEAGYVIGSGAVESAHKQIVHVRMRQAGMRWSERGAERLLALRVRYLNGEWDTLDRLVMQKVAV